MDGEFHIILKILLSKSQMSKNKTAIASHEIELMFYTMIAYTYADINRGELISRLKTYYKTAVWNMAGDAGEKIEKDMTGFKDIFNIRFDDVGQHDYYQLLWCGRLAFE